MSYSSASTTAANTDSFSSWQINAATGSTNLVRAQEEQGTAVASNQWLTLAIGALVSAILPTIGQWFKPRPHELHKFRYVQRGRTLPRLGAQQKLAPIDEEMEVDPRQALRHLRRLLRNPRYRAWQLKMINQANKKTGLTDVTYDEAKVKEELKRLYISPKQLRKLELKHQRELAMLKRAQAKAEDLLQKCSAKQQIIQLEKEKRLEIIAKNGCIYEILADGRVNKLLADGKKQGLCIVPTDGAYPVADVILAKKMMLETDPDKLEEIAHKTTPFILAK